MKPDRPDHLEHRQRLKERYERTGLDGLPDYEILELLLFYAIPQGDVKPRAKDLLRRFGSLQGVLEAGRDELQTVKGIGPHSSLFFRLLSEVSALYLRRKAETREQISSTKELIDYCLSSMGG